MDLSQRKPCCCGWSGLSQDTLFHVPGAETFEGCKEVVGKGDRSVGGGLGICRLPRFRKEDERTFLPEAGGVLKVETGAVYNTQNVKHSRGQVEEKKRTGLNPSGPGVFLAWKWEMDSRIESSMTMSSKCSIMTAVGEEAWS